MFGHPNKIPRQTKVSNVLITEEVIPDHVCLAAGSANETELKSS